MATHILLIDDDPVINFIHSRVIKTQFPNIPIFIFENAHRAMEYLRSYPLNSYLIFLDLNMPVMNGWDFLEIIASEDTALKFQIHILTSSIDPVDKIKANNNKLVLSYILKPLKSDDLKKLSFSVPTA